MLVATWNVNSIKARDERVRTWLGARRPDVLCLQELKVVEDAFPHDALRALGYEAAVFGQKAYNGVAILSRLGLRDVRRGFLDDGAPDEQARLISAVVGPVTILSVYVPNGQTVGSDKWVYKLAWMKRLRAYLERHHRPADPIIVCGDFNVAPEERDVARPDQWRGTVLFHDEARAALADLTSWGLIDCFRKHVTASGHYSWWDYRMLGFQRGNGLRIDHVFATAPVAEACTTASIDRDERKGELASDHAPVLADFALPAP